MMVYIYILCVSCVFFKLLLYGFVLMNCEGPVYILKYVLNLNILSDFVFFS